MRFVLVHGGYHGGWCWAKLRPELEALGHSTVAVDLPGLGDRQDEVATHGSWRGALRDVIEDGDVLVGHSMGGYAITLAADEVPEKVGHLVYLAAAVPASGETVGVVNDMWPDLVGMPWEDFMEDVELPKAGRCRRFTNQDAANTIFFHDCAPSDQDWAWERLVPQPLSIMDEPFDLPRFATAPAARHYIVTTDDRALPAAYMGALMQRLGVVTGAAIASSHSPFVSRPAETAAVLDGFVGGGR